MANKEHLAKLHEGPEAWNKWQRKQGRHFRPDLQGADLIDFNLQGAMLWNANLEGAVLLGADLKRTAFGWANLQSADMSFSNLRNTGFWRANLQSADLFEADLQGTNLQGAHYWQANFWNDQDQQKHEPFEPIAISSVSEFLDNEDIQKLIKTSDQPYFRGESDINYKLAPVINRYDKVRKAFRHQRYEADIMTDMMTRNPASFEQSSHFAKMVTARHHGLPNRLLDVTRNPLVALFNASGGNQAVMAMYIFFCQAKE